ncbi:MAG: RidA family protein [Caulobacteraceae bacterium]
MVERITRQAMKPMLEPYGLCEAVAAGGLLHLSGQTGLDPETGRVAPGGLRAQAKQAFRNIKEVIEAAGGGTANILSLTWYVVEGDQGRTFLDDAIAITAAREEVFPGLVAASTAVRVKALLTPDFLVEIAAVAAL